MKNNQKPEPCGGLYSEDIIEAPLRIVEPRSSVCTTCHWCNAETCRECKAQEAETIIKKGTMYQEKYIPWREEGGWK